MRKETFKIVWDTRDYQGNLDGIVIYTSLNLPVCSYKWEIDYKFRDMTVYESVSKYLEEKGECVSNFYYLSFWQTNRSYICYSSLNLPVYTFDIGDFQEFERKCYKQQVRNLDVVFSRYLEMETQLNKGENT